VFSDKIVESKPEVETEPRPLVSTILLLPSATVKAVQSLLIASKTNQRIMKTSDSSSRRGLSEAMGFQFRSALLISACAVAFGVRTEAAVIRVDFTSKVTFIQGGGVFGASPSLGDLVTGFFTYDMTAPDLNPGDPAKGIYRTGRMAVTVDGKLFENEFVPEVVVHTAKEFEYSVFGIGTGDITGNSNELTYLVDGVSTGPGSFFFDFRTFATPLTADELPDPQSLLLFEVSQFAVAQEDGILDRFIIFDDLQTLEARIIPEPTTLSLLGLGSLALVMRLRQK